MPDTGVSERSERNELDTLQAKAGQALAERGLEQDQIAEVMRMAGLMDDIHSLMGLSPEISKQNIEVNPGGITIGGRRTETAFSGRHLLGEMLKPGRRGEDAEDVVAGVRERLMDTYTVAQEHGLLAEDAPIHREVLAVPAEKVLEEFGFTPAQINYAFDLLGTIDQILETVRSSPQAARGEVVVDGKRGLMEYRMGEDLRGQATVRPARYYLEAISQREDGFRGWVGGEGGSPEVYLKHLDEELVQTFAAAAALDIPLPDTVRDKVLRCLGGEES